MSQSDDKKPPAKKSRPVKKARDTPSRPLSAYNFFFREQRAKILEEREEEAKATGKVPDKSDLFSILGKTIAQRWKGKTEADRQPYRDMAAQDMKRYRKEMDEYHEAVSKNFDLEKDEAAAAIRIIKKPRAKKVRKVSVGYESTTSTTKHKSKESAAQVSAIPSVPSVTLPIPGGSTQASPLSLDALNYHLGLQGGQVLNLPPSVSADLLAHQNLIRQRELVALQQQQQRQQRLGLLSGLTNSGLAGDSILPTTSLGHSGTFSGSLPGLLSLSLNSSMPSQSILPVCSGLTPGEELYLLNSHNQPSAGLTVQQSLELMQRNQPSADMSASNLSLLQHRQLLLEQQRLIERRRIEQFLAARSPPGPGNLPPPGL